jgi:hypothetical protein
VQLRAAARRPFFERASGLQSYGTIDTARRAASGHKRDILGVESLQTRVVAIMRAIVMAIALTVAWAWGLLAGVGGLVLLIHEGPWPMTNGWFAMFSGLAACPLSAWLLKRYANIKVPLGAQLAIALLIMIAGRIAVVLVLHRPFLPHCSHDCW